MYFDNNFMFKIQMHIAKKIELFKKAQNTLMYLNWKICLCKTKIDKILYFIIVWKAVRIILYANIKS